jgi:predicted ATPase
VITKLEIQGFRSIEQLQLDMAPLTVLIGPNGSGKSNLLDAFALVSSAAAGGLSDGLAKRGGYDTIHFRGAQDQKMFFELEFAGVGAFQEEEGTVHYRVELRPSASVARVWFEQVNITDKPGYPAPLVVAQRKVAECKFRNILSREKEEPKGIESDTELAIFQVKDQTAYPTPYKLAREMSSWRVYPPIATGEDAPVRRPQLLRSGLRLGTDGGNLASVLHAIQNQHPAVWEELCDVLQTACAEFRHLSFPPEGGDGLIVLRWWEEPFERDYGFSANVLSDGTLRLLMLLALLLSPDPPPLVCIDEPELGLHPDWVKLIGELLRSAAARTQLVVATHSPELVSKLTPSDVVVVEKEDGRTVANRLSDAEFAQWLDEFRLGDLWRAGHLGGRP